MPNRKTWNVSLLLLLLLALSALTIGAAGAGARADAYDSVSLRIGSDGSLTEIDRDNVGFAPSVFGIAAT